MTSPEPDRSPSVLPDGSCVTAPGPARAGADQTTLGERPVPGLEHPLRVAAESGLMSLIPPWRMRADREARGRREPKSARHRCGCRGNPALAADRQAGATLSVVPSRAHRAPDDSTSTDESRTEIPAPPPGIVSGLPTVLLLDAPPRASGCRILLISSPTLAENVYDKRAVAVRGRFGNGGLHASRH